MRIANEPIITNGDMSQVSLTSTQVKLDHIGQFAVCAVYSGAPVGTLKLQASTDSTTPATNWADITGSSTAVNGAGIFIWNIANVGFNYVQAVYTKTSGTGTLNVNINLKGF